MLKVKVKCLRYDLLEYERKRESVGTYELGEMFVTPVLTTGLGVWCTYRTNRFKDLGEVLVVVNFLIWAALSSGSS